MRTAKPYRYLYRFSILLLLLSILGLIGYEAFVVFIFIHFVGFDWFVLQVILEEDYRIFTGLAILFVTLFLLRRWGRPK